MNIKNITLILSVLAGAILTTLCAAQTVTLFSHGIADTGKRQVGWYTKSYMKDDVVHHNERVTIHTPFTAFNYPDATNRFYRVNYNETSFGQGNEIGRLYKAYQKTNERFENCDMIHRIHESLEPFHLSLHLYNEFQHRAI